MIIAPHYHLTTTRRISSGLKLLITVTMKIIMKAQSLKGAHLGAHTIIKIFKIRKLKEDKNHSSIALIDCETNWIHFLITMA